MIEFKINIKEIGEYNFKYINIDKYPFLVFSIHISVSPKNIFYNINCKFITKYPHGYINYNYETNIEDSKLLIEDQINLFLNNYFDNFKPNNNFNNYDTIVLKLKLEQQLEQKPTIIKRIKI